MKNNERWRKYVIIVVVIVTLPSMNNAQTAKKNPPEILELFGSTTSSNLTKQSDAKYYSEGGSHTIDKKDSITIDSDRKQTMTHLAGHEHGYGSINTQNSSTKTENVTVIPSKNNHNVSNQSKDSSNDSSKPLQWSENVNAELSLGAPEVDHANGPSSTKARKGVNLDDDPNKSLPQNSSCLTMMSSKCYNESQFPNIKCHCCNNTDTLGAVISQQMSSGCILCGSECGVCCQNASLDLSKMTTDSVTNRSSTTISTVLKPSSSLQSEDVKNKSPLKENIKVDTLNVSSGNATRKMILKPDVTKVPYDVEVVPAPLIKSKKEIVIPIIVSVFILPLVGILIFFICRRTREFWDKRYYRRMDFLIDGIYND